MRIVTLILCFLAPVWTVFAQNPEPGRRQFENRCAGCHGGDANGGEHGPGILERIAAKSNQELVAFIRAGSPANGMPAFNLPGAELREIIAFLRTLAPEKRPEVRLKIQLT